MSIYTQYQILIDEKFSVELMYEYKCLSSISHSVKVVKLIKYFPHVSLPFISVNNDNIEKIKEV